MDRLVQPQFSSRVLKSWLRGTFGGFEPVILFRISCFLGLPNCNQTMGMDTFKVSRRLFEVSYRLCVAKRVQIETLCTEAVTYPFRVVCIMLNTKYRCLLVFHYVCPRIQNSAASG
jgi:hypothetical protein